MHDRLTIQSLINQQLLDASIAAKYPIDDIGNILYQNINDRGIFFQISSDYTREDRIEAKILSEKLENCLYITNIETLNVDLNYSQLTIEAYCKVSIPFSFVRKLLGNEKMVYKETISDDVFRPAEYVRIFTVFAEVVEGTNIGDEVLSKLHKVLEGGS